MLNAHKRVVCLARVAAHLVAALLRVTILFPLCSAQERRRQIEAWSRKALTIFGLSLVVVRDQRAGCTQPNLLVANHVSWLDIFAIWVATDAVFVAKSDVARWPVIGFLARHLGVMFVDRAKRSDVVVVGRAISNALKDGRTVCIFPEGTTTEGRALQSFRTALFQPAIEQGVAVQPLAIRYFRADGMRAKEAAFVGDMSLAASMWGLAAGVPITIDVSFLQSLDTAGQDRRSLAKAAEILVRDALYEPAPELQALAGTAAELAERTSDIGAIAYPAR
jgi:1-acyl-sn-glycerol-3-phosphate acyltransferase